MKRDFGKKGKKPTNIFSLLEAFNDQEQENYPSVY